MMTRSHDIIRRDLLELVAALDRRVPTLDRERERDIARDAQAFRRAALKRIADLERTLGAVPLSTAPRDTA